MTKTKKEEKAESPAEMLRRKSMEVFHKKYGEESVGTAADEDKGIFWLQVPDLGFQYALGRPGFALGRIATIVGFEGSSKTSMALWIADLAMCQGGVAAMVESENAGSTEHMQYYVRSPQDLIINKPGSLEQGMEMTLDTLKIFEDMDPAIPKVLIFDSIAGSSLERELEEDREIGDEKVGGKGKFMSKAVEKIKPKLKKTNTLWVVCNQGRELISTGPFAAMVPEMDKVVAAGGKAIPFSATYYMITKKGATKKSKGEVGEKAGFSVKMTFKKNKLRFPFRDLYYNVIWKQSLQFQEHTLDLLETGKILGTASEGGQYWCPGIGIEKRNKKPAEEFYTLVHSPEQIRKFQDALDIKLDVAPGENVSPDGMPETELPAPSQSLPAPAAV